MDRASRRGARGQSVVELALVLPILLIMLLAVADLARLYTTMIAVESAAREASDYGAFDSQYWNDEPGVRLAMTHRACLASSDLPDYEGTRDDLAATCTNPDVVAIELIEPAGSTGCTDSQNPHPCWVRTTLEYDFRLILPLSIRLFDVEYGFPASITFQRQSTFAMTDLQLAPTP